MIVGLVVLGMVAVAAVVGYVVIEDLDLLEAIYVVVITLSTVGFGEPGEGFSTAGKMVTIGLIGLGVSASVYTVSGMVDLVLDSLNRERRQRMRAERTIAALAGHTVVCGYGRVGRRVMELLAAEGRETVVVELDEGLVDEARQRFSHVIHGDAARDVYLEAAGIDRARTLVAAVGSDADNLAIVLSARARRPDLYILARGGDEESQRKLRLAGADRVVAPEAAGAERLARMATHRGVTEFVEVATGERQFAFEVEELTIDAGAPFAGRSLADSGIRAQAGVLVLAVQHADGVISAPPAASTLIRAGDVLVVLGSEEQIDRLRRLAAGRRVSRD